MPADPYHPRHATPLAPARTRRRAPRRPRPAPTPTADPTPSHRGRWAAVAAVVAALCALVASSVASADPTARTDSRSGAPQLGGPGRPGAAAPHPAARSARAAGSRPAPTPAQLARITHAKVSAPAGKAVIAGLAGNGIPNVALNAYRVAADRMAHAQPSCGIDWALLAGIGREESDHGRFGGARLNADGTSTPPVIGPALDGTGAEYIPAPADGQRLDGDAVYTHALGPMQFIPQTWAAYGADGNGDGRADIFNIDDAALGAARYLCASGGDLRTHAGQVRAILAYNHSDQYLAQVLALAAAYRTGTPVTGAPVGDVTGALPPVTATIPYAVDPGPPTAAGSSPVTAAGESRSTGKPQHGTTRHRPTRTAPGATASPQPTHAPKPTTRPQPGSPGGSTTPPSPTAPAPTPTPTPSGGLPTSLPTKLPIGVPTLPNPTSSTSSTPVRPAPSSSACVLGLNGTCIVP